MLAMSNLRSGLTLGASGGHPEEGTEASQHCSTFRHFKGNTAGLQMGLTGMGVSSQCASIIAGEVTGIPEWKLDQEGTLSLVNQGLTNQTIRISMPSGLELAARIPGQDSHFLNIDRTREAAVYALIRGRGVGPDVFYSSPTDGLLITRWMEGMPLTPEMAGTDSNLASVAQTLKRIHEGPAFPGPTRSLFDSIRELLLAAVERGPTLPVPIEKLLEFNETLEKSVGPIQNPRPTHWDAHPRNMVVAADGRIILLDWENSTIGDPMADLALYCGDRILDEPPLTTIQKKRLLEFYYGPENVTSVLLARLNILHLAVQLRIVGFDYLQSRISKIKDFDFVAEGNLFLERFRGTFERDFQSWRTEVGSGEPLH
jgi:thiamine kinase-like enzyme